MDDYVFQTYGTSFDDIAPGINQRVQETAVAGEDYLTTLQRILSSLALTYQQQQLMALNIERAKRGQPPVDIAQYSGIGVNVGLNTGTQNLLMWGGAAVLAAFVFSSLMKR